MPYGIAKEHGGDSPANVRKMERCVRSCMESNPNYDKRRCIAACKKSIFGKRRRKQ